MSKLKQIETEVRRGMSSLSVAGGYKSEPQFTSTNQYFSSSATFTSNENGASSSSTSITNALNQTSQSSHPLPEEHILRQLTNDKRTPEELENVAFTVERLKACIVHDHSMITNPDMDSPFTDESDVIQRLLPYHVFQQPKEDLRTIVSGKGKEKAREAVKEELHATKLALQLFKRREAIRNRWRKLKINSARRSSPDDQAYYLAQVVLESDRSENAWIANELRNARAEAERIEREKRAISNTSRISHFSAIPQTSMPAMQTQYYRAYPYAYTQAYGSPVPAPTMSTFSVAPPSAPVPYPPHQSSSAIPVQLPVASLPALHALGIIPVPAASLPPEGQPQPPAVLRGSTGNGTILSLEINVSLLQSAQMSGLAIVLNNLVGRSNAAAASGANAPSPVPAASKGSESSST